MNSRRFGAVFSESNDDVSNENLMSGQFLEVEALEELKEQADYSCILCAFDDMDDEDWE